MRLGTYLAEDRVRTSILAAHLVVQLALVGWDLPSSFSWENDGVAPRDIPVAVALNLTPGQGYRYPLLHPLLLAVPCLPFLAPAALQARSFALDDLRAAALNEPTMTACSLVAKAVAVGMGLVALVALGAIADRLFSRRAARWAMFLAAANVSVAYYGRTSNLDGPALMWTTLALWRLVRDEPGDPLWVGLFTAAAVATKDQFYAPFLLLVPWIVRRPRAVLGLSAYLVLSGAILNPTGFVSRVRTMLGPASGEYRAYSADLSGALANLSDLAAAQADFFWAWPIVALAWIGVVLAFWRFGVPSLLPFLAGLGSVLGFALLVGRCEHRFVLPFGFFLSLYAGVAAAALARHHVLAAAVALVAAVGPATLAAAQLGDARHAVERWLDRTPPGTRVETYGPLVYLPRFRTDRLDVSRVGPEPIPGRNPLLGMTEIVGPPAATRPDVILVTQGYAERYLRRAEGAGRVVPRNAVAAQADAGARALVVAALADRLPAYRVALVAQPSFPPWMRALGLEPRAIHQSTAQTQWVLVRTGGRP